MAKKALADVLESDSYKLKRFFYALRASIACLWILDKEDIPPIEFPRMLDALDIDASIKQQITALIALKAGKSEAYTHHGEQALIELMSQCIARSEQQASQLPSSTRRLDDLNDFFRTMLSSWWP